MGKSKGRRREANEVAYSMVTGETGLPQKERRGESHLCPTFKKPGGEYHRESE